MSKVFVIAVAWIIFLPSPAYSIETSRALLERASADLDAGKIDSSLALAERCIKLYPRCAGAFLIKARCLEVNNNIEGALQSVRAAARMDKNLPEVYKHYGSIACEAGKYNEGIEALSAAIKLYPQTKSYYHYRSMAYGAIKRYDLAIKDLDEYLKLGPEKSVGWFWRGAAYEQVGNTARAIKDYSMAVKLKPQSADFLVARAKAYEKLGKLDLALKDMTRASKIDFMDQDVWKCKGDLNFKLGHYREAIRDYSEGIELEPHFASKIYSARARVYERLGNIEQAKRDRELAKKMKNRPAVKKI